MKNNLISLKEDPIKLFAKWFKDAKNKEINDPNAMNLSTVSENNKPSSRIVLLKSYSDQGFIFYTNTLSKKGKSLSKNKFVSLNFYWKTLKKQIRIEGKTVKVNNKTADKYFYSRPIESQIGAWASIQSKNLKNRLELKNRFNDYEIKFKNKKVTRPPHWSGYIVVPNLIEFWQEMPHRLHDRVEFKKIKSTWKAKNLFP